MKRTWSLAGLAAALWIAPAGAQFDDFNPKEPIGVHGSPEVKKPVVQGGQFIPRLPGPSTDYLIVVPDRLEATVEPLAEWKRTKGLRTRVVPLSEIGDAPGFEKIDAYVEKIYESSPTPIRYLLLAGDVEDIPPHYREDDTGTSEDGLVCSDLFYGIVGDGLFADMRVGRFPADNPYDFGNIVEKTLAYEKSPDLLGGDWFSRCLFFGRDVEVNGSGAEDAEAMEALGWETYAFAFTSDMTPSPATEMVLAKLNAGVSLVTYYGHGDPWWMWGFSMTDVLHLRNGGRLPLWISGGCSSGRYDLETHPYDSVFGAGAESFAERMLNQPGRGAVGIIGTSRSGGPGYDYVFFDACREEMVEGGGMGDIMDAGKEYAYWAAVEAEGEPWVHVTEADRLYHLEHYNLLGDPELAIYTEWPRRLKLTVSEYKGPVYTVAGGGPVEDALVCLRREGNELLTAETDENGLAVFDPPSSWTDFTVTVTAHNYIPKSLGYERIYCSAGATSVLDPEGRVKIKVEDAGEAEVPRKVYRPPYGLWTKVSRKPLR